MSVKSLVFIFSIGLLGFWLSSCQKPRIPIADDSGQVGVITGGLNFERNHFLPKDILLPQKIEKQYSINGQTTWTMGLHQNHLILTTRNGFLSTHSLSNLGKKRRTRLSKGITAEPTLYKNNLYVAMEVGKFGLRVFDFDKGNVLWQLPGFHSKSSPVVTDDLVFHTSKDGNILCLDAKRGIKIWEARINDLILTSLAYSPGNLIAVSQNGTVRNYEPSSGLVLWDESVKESVYAQPLLVNQAVYIVSFAGNLYRLSLNSGLVYHLDSFGVNVYLPPSSDGALLFIPLSDGKLVAFDLNAGHTLWTTPLEGPASIPVLVSNRHVVVGTSKQFLYFLNKESGEIEQTIKLKGRPSSLPVIHEQKLILGVGYDQLTMLIPESG